MVKNAKHSIWMIAVLYSMFFLVACDRTEQTNDNGQEIEVPPTPPPYCDVHGAITNEDNQPLDSVQVIIDHTVFYEHVDSNSYYYEYVTSFKTYSDEDGGYDITISGEEWRGWPEEVTVTAVDPVGIYETQQKTVPVTIFARFTWTDDYIDGIANADFVMHKKAE